MNDTPVPGTGLARRPVLCGRCGGAWDERLVEAAASSSSDGGLCPSCLLATSHGLDPYPGDPA